MNAWTPRKPDLSTIDRNLLLNARNHTVIGPYTVQEIIDKSESFPVKFPVDTGRLKTLKNKENITEQQLTKNINSAYPFVHEHVLKLYLDFIELKKNGSAFETALYKDMDLKQFVERLLTKRAVMFMGRDDKYLLICGETGSKNWETIGTDAQSPPLTLQNCLSYDEVKLSAFLYVSSYTYFVNKGERKNYAVYSEDRAGIQEEGVIAGMIGPRFRKQGFMDFQEIVITQKQNKESNGYGDKPPPSIHKLFSNFYDEPRPALYEAALHNRKSNPARYVDIKTPKGAIFDNQVYHKRLTIAFDCLLIEANARAKEAHKSAYVYVVGLGLGVWRTSDHQEGVYMECFYNRIRVLSDKLASVSDICFAYINQESCGGYGDGDCIPLDNHPSKGIKIHICKREPHEKLSDKDKLLVVSYAWDGNALPGNEYWSGKLGSSGDSAAASATQIAELHNPHINPAVCSDNLRVATSSGEILRLSSYVEQSSKRERAPEANEGGSSSKKLKCVYNWVFAAFLRMARFLSRCFVFVWWRL